MFKGRINRKEYLIGFFVAAVPIYGAVYRLITRNNNIPAETIDTITILLFVLSLFFTLSLQIRRAHDIGESGWWVINPFILWKFNWWWRKGQRTTKNKYGPPDNSISLKRIFLGN